MKKIKFFYGKTSPEDFSDLEARINAFLGSYPQSTVLPPVVEHNIRGWGDRPNIDQDAGVETETWCIVSIIYTEGDVS